MGGCKWGSRSGKRVELKVCFERVVLHYGLCSILSMALGLGKDRAIPIPYLHVMNLHVMNNNTQGGILHYTN